MMKGKVAIVTGGARDIGRQVSLKLAAAGAKVCINYFGNEELAKETLQMVKDIKRWGWILYTSECIAWSCMYGSRSAD